MSSSKHLHKSHNVSLMLYHLVCSTKYRRLVLSPKVDRIVKKTCLGIEDRYEIYFVEVGSDKNHVHLLLQGVPTYSPTKIARTVKCITAREIFAQAPGVKRALWGGAFWQWILYYTVGRHCNEKVIAAYVKNQGSAKDYQVLHKSMIPNCNYSS